MLTSLGLVLLFANTPQEQTTLPRQMDSGPAEQQAQQPGKPTDPLFDRSLVASDDPSFVLGVIESGRQGVVDARALGDAATPALRAAAGKIEKQNRDTTRRLETLANRKGWRVPEDNPQRASTLPEAVTPARYRANFIVNQIAFHEATVAKFRAQIAGKGDAELKRTLRESLPGYERNLRSLLELEPAAALASQ